MVLINTIHMELNYTMVYITIHKNKTVHLFRIFTPKY